MSKKKLKTSCLAALVLLISVLVSLLDLVDAAADNLVGVSELVCVLAGFQAEYHLFVEEFRKHPGSTWIMKPVGQHIIHHYTHAYWSNIVVRWVALCFIVMKTSLPFYQQMPETQDCWNHSSFSPTLTLTTPKIPLPRWNPHPHPHRRRKLKLFLRSKRYSDIYFADPYLLGICWAPTSRRKPAATWLIFVKSNFFKALLLRTNFRSSLLLIYIHAVCFHAYRKVVYKSRTRIEAALSPNSSCT